MMADLDNIPSLPPPKTADTYTLLLDLDETLIHYYENDGPGHYNVRPGMYKFLETMNALGYELVIFTAATQEYADWVVGQIDPKGLIHYRLYRQHALPWGPLFAKDFSRLGRDLDRTLIIDNVQENFMKHPDNGIYINTWYDDMSDTALTNLTPLLEEIITTRARVPDILKKYELQIPRWAGIEPDFAQVTSESYDGDQLCEADNLERERNDSEDAKTFGLTPACQIITTHGGVDATDMNGSKTAREHGRTYGDLRFSDLLAQLNEQQQPQ
jgi:Dullard-like phosphatase family protein